MNLGHLNLKKTKQCINDISKRKTDNRIHNYKLSETNQCDGSREDKYAKTRASNSECVEKVQVVICSMLV